MSGTSPDRRPATGESDLFDRVSEETGDLFDRVDLDMALKDDLYELIGDAIKSAMRLREGFPVRLTAPHHDVSSEIGSGQVIDLYLAETATLIDAHWEQIAARVARFVNDEMH